jgi:hypothetical protein
MCDDVMSLPNDLVYCGQLAAGSAAVASARLELPRPSALARHPAWLRPLLAPSVTVAFLDTDAPEGEGAPPPGGEVQLREGTVNPGEAAAAAALVAALLDAGVPPGEVGVVSPYRAQVRARGGWGGGRRGGEGRGRGAGWLGGHAWLCARLCCAVAAAALARTGRPKRGRPARDEPRLVLSNPMSPPTTTTTPSPPPR